MVLLVDGVSCNKSFHVNNYNSNIYNNYIVSAFSGDSTLTMKQLVAQCFVFFLAGYETSSSTMAFALLELVLHPELQDKVRKEILDVLKKYDNKICYDAMQELTYMQQVIEGT